MTSKALWASITSTIGVAPNRPNSGLRASVTRGRGDKVRGPVRGGPTSIKSAGLHRRTPDHFRGASPSGEILLSPCIRRQIHPVQNSPRHNRSAPLIIGALREKGNGARAPLAISQRRANGANSAPRCGGDGAALAE